MEKFTSFNKAQRYINELGYTFKARDTFKEDRSYLYHNKKTKQHMFLKSNYGFLSAGSMEMGVVWTVQRF
jgi:hypothetical protein